MNVTELRNALAAHRGRDKGISADALAKLLKVTTRQLRKLISDARQDGTAICGHPSTGYFIAETPAELDESCAFLRQRALHSLKLESVLRGVPMPTLLGQLQLNQG